MKLRGGFHWVSNWDQSQQKPRTLPLRQRKKRSETSMTPSTSSIPTISVSIEPTTLPNGWHDLVKPRIGSAWRIRLALLVMQLLWPSQVKALQQDFWLLSKISKRRVITCKYKIPKMLFILLNVLGSGRKLPPPSITSVQFLRTTRLLQMG